MSQNLELGFSLDRPYESADESRVYRTPDAAFATLPDFPYTPSYLWVDSQVNDIEHALRMSYVDVGQRFGPVILLLHGEPTWSFLYRKIIANLSGKYRIIVPDLIGFGRSDKLLHRNDYSYARHIRWLEQFVERLNLEQITLFCQDWGSLIGLRIAANPKFTWRFARISVGNGGLPTGEKTTEGFKRWRAYIEKLGENDEMPIGKLVSGGTTNGISEDEQKAYNAPYPTIPSQAGARAFPLLVPFTADSPEGQLNKSALNYLSKQSIPFLLLFSDSDPVTKNGEKVFENFVGAQLEGVKNLHGTIKNAGHFLQEDGAQQIAQKLDEFLQKVKPANLKKSAKL